ncbi:MAG TPA: LuxR C-terminal-related transcriptional regulator [Acidimicrobiales bacterium]|jgi:DNA-binding NarL/FixJ family response regulator|nr:LuxR C-terminal-related transcriptional regulator [Acidimicrobiales bacterium]
MVTEAPLRTVLVVEPQRLVRQALVAAIGTAPGLAAVDAAASGARACDRVDAALIAARSLGHGWVGLIEAASRSGGPSPVVLVAEHGPFEPSVDSRGLVVVSRQTPLSAVIACLQAGPDGPSDLPLWQTEGAATDRLLSARERQVLGLLASGLSPAQAARALDITTYTVRDHIKSIRSKLDRPTTMSAVLEAIRLGLLRVEQA